MLFHPIMNSLDFRSESSKLISNRLFDYCAHLVIADVVLFLVETLLDELAVEWACTETGSEAYLTILCF